MKEERFTVNSLRYDHSVRRSWECDLVTRSNEVVELVGQFDGEVQHSELGLIKTGTQSIEFFYTSRWYNHFIFLEPNGSLRNHYFNICMPPTIGKSMIDYVDLDIDLVVWPNGKVITLDLDEFEANAGKFQYPEEIRKKALDTLSELKGLMNDGICRFASSTFIDISQNQD